MKKLNVLQIGLKSVISCAGKESLYCEFIKIEVHSDCYRFIATNGKVLAIVELYKVEYKEDKFLSSLTEDIFIHYKVAKQYISMDVNILNSVDINFTTEKNSDFNFPNYKAITTGLWNGSCDNVKFCPAVVQNILKVFEVLEINCIVNIPSANSPAQFTNATTTDLIKSINTYFMPIK